VDAVLVPGGVVGAGDPILGGFVALVGPPCEVEVAGPADVSESSVKTTFVVRILSSRTGAESETLDVHVVVKVCSAIVAIVSQVVVGSVRVTGMVVAS
jgi:hypothetical protein